MRPAMLALAVVLLWVSAAAACPSCKESLNSSQADVVRGYFYSILFMISMPILILSGLGALMYREVRRAQAARQAAPADSGELHQA
jgi:hypothetical protein